MLSGVHFDRHEFTEALASAENPTVSFRLHHRENDPGYKEEWRGWVFERPPLTPLNNILVYRSDTFTADNCEKWCLECRMHLVPPDELELQGQPMRALPKLSLLCDDMLRRPVEWLEDVDEVECQGEKCRRDFDVWDNQEWCLSCHGDWEPDVPDFIVDHLLADTFVLTDGCRDHFISLSVVSVNE